MPTPEQTRIVIETAAALDGAAHGAGKAIIAAACERAGCCAQTLHTWMRPYRESARKRRSDYVDRSAEAELTLTRAEADLISATLVESTRQNAKRIMSIGKAVEVLRRDGHIVAGRIDPDTGEVLALLSESAIGRALTRYGVHPDQLTRPTAHQPKRTLHPNHEWQVDASVCVVYYLPGGGTQIQELDPAVHYKNKPENIRAIELFRVIRYVVADHCSGVIRWRYYPHSESGAHTVAFLAWAMAPKPNVLADPFQGAPFQLVVDPGATASGTVQRFCKLARVKFMPTGRKNPRAKGSVEKGNDLVECGFESGLKFQRHRIRDFADLNLLAEREQVHWNATAIHTRHGMTRTAAWMLIRPEQLRLTESEADLRALATESPATPTVRGDLTVAYKRGAVARWDVKAVPGVNVGDKIQVLWSPLIGADGQGHAVAVVTDPATGLEVYHPLTAVRVDEWGFQASAPVSGEEYQSKPDSDIDKNRKRLSKLASGTETQDADELARRRKDFRPLAHLDDGRGLNPYREAEEAPPVTWMPRRGTEHRVTAPTLAPVVLDVMTAALRLAPMVRALGGEWGPEQYGWLDARYPGGVPEDTLEALARECVPAIVAAEVPLLQQAGGLRIVR